MVMYGMLTEISWVSLLGMLNGAVVAGGSMSHCTIRSGKIRVWR